MQLYIFDLDGTLLDTLPDICESINNTLTELGFNIQYKKDDVKKFLGEGRVQLIKGILPEDSKSRENIEKATEIYMKNYGSFCDVYTKPFDGITEVLNSLKSCGKKLALLTNKPHINAVYIAEKYFPGIFDIVYGVIDDNVRKPNPLYVNKICSDLCMPHDDICFIGDSNIDIFTGKNAGVLTIGVTWGYREKEELITAGADYIIDNPKEIFSIC